MVTSVIIVRFTVLDSLNGLSVCALNFIIIIIITPYLLEYYSQ